MNDKEQSFEEYDHYLQLDLESEAAIFISAIRDFQLEEKLGADELSRLMFFELNFHVASTVVAV